MSVKFICTNCDNVFATNHGLQYHVQKNVCKKGTGKETFECNKCKKIIKNAKNYKHHVDNNICTKENRPVIQKEYICKNCNKIYSSSSSLSNHKRKGCNKVLEDICKVAEKVNVVNNDDKILKEICKIEKQCLVLRQLLQKH